MSVRTLVLAFVLAFAACTDLNEVAAPDDVLLLGASPTSIPANGYSVSIITAQISTQANETLRDVIFTTTLGRFPGADPATPQVAVATVGSDGKATMALQSTAQTGTAVVTAEIRDGEAVKIAQSIEIQFASISTSDVIVVLPSTAQAPADGATVTLITARVATGVLVLQRSVQFTTSAGSFGISSPAATSRTANADGTASADLVSPRTASVALVTATVNNIQAATTVTFEPALPDRIAVTVFGNLQMKATFATKVTLEAQLERVVGTVTPGTEVIFRAFDESTGGSFGFFSGVTLSDSTGRVTAEFTPGNTTERGEATIRVRVPGTEILGRVRIEIVNP